MIPLKPRKMPRGAAGAFKAAARKRTLPKRMAKAAARAFQRAEWQARQAAERDAKKRSASESTEFAGGMRLIPNKKDPNFEYKMQEIMESLEKGWLPERFRRLKLSQTQKKELYELLKKYYTGEIQDTKSSDWNRLEQILKAGNRMGAQPKKSLRGAKITNIRRRRIAPPKTFRNAA